jgi:hypothetical protein
LNRRLGAPGRHGYRTSAWLVRDRLRTTPCSPSPRRPDHQPWAKAVLRCCERLVGSGQDGPAARFRAGNSDERSEQSERRCIVALGEGSEWHCSPQSIALRKAQSTYCQRTRSDAYVQPSAC